MSYSEPITVMCNAFVILCSGVVVRLWLHQGQQNNDQVVLVWGAYFSGLVYLGPRLISNASHFNENTVVLHMQGGYFTDRHSLKELPATAMARNLSIMLPVVDTRPSYSVSLLLRCVFCSNWYCMFFTSS